ncbi:MAG: peptidase S41, partial [Oscillospiraceae bacterium]|nr:peptidase S41 [Oscillospiraceae bacterium]
ILLLLLGFLCAVLLFLLPDYSEKIASPKWRLCYLMPGLLCMILILLADFEISMIPVYSSAVLLATGFFRDQKAFRKKIAVISAVLVLLACPICLCNPGYREIDYLADFEKGFAQMQKRYVLADHKGIDLETLHQKYKPEFREATRNQDAVANLLAWQAFCAEFYDGHTSFTADDETLIDSAKNAVYGNDYGLSMMALPDGRTVAVNIEADSIPAESGIHNGTQILAWDGMTPEQAADQAVVTRYLSYPDRDNQEFYHVIYGAGVGADQVEITFLDDTNTEKTIQVPKIGLYAERCEETIQIINRGIEAGNLTWTELTPDTVALRLKSMMSDSKTYTSGDYTGFKNQLREEIADYQAKGIRNVIIDLRSNSGGSGKMIEAIASLFAPEGTHYRCTGGVWDSMQGCYETDPETKKFLAGEDQYFQGENILGNGRIVMLVNSETISAGDHLIYAMQDMENVTIMGFTESNGSAQGVSSPVVLESGIFVFSTSLMLNQEQEILIDSGTDHQSGNKLDVRIPFDEDAMNAIFVRDEDYLLTKALEFLES